MTGAARLLRKGHRAVRRRRIEAAVVAFFEAAERAPLDRRAHIQLALAQARRGDCDAARATVAAMIERFPDDPVVQLSAGRCLLECGDAAGAEPLLLATAQAQPENFLAQQYLALCLLMRGDFKSAGERLDQVGLAASTDFLALLSHEVERLLATAPRDGVKDNPQPAAPSLAAVSALEKRAGAETRSGLIGKVARRRAARKLVRLGERAFDRRDFDGALAAFEAARRIGSRDPLVLLGLGLANLRLDRPTPAAQFLAAAYAQSPADGFVVSSYADALHRAGLFAESLAVFERIEPAGPEDFHANYGRGACLAALGRRTEALEAFRTAFERYRLDTVEDCLIPSWRQLSESPRGR